MVRPQLNRDIHPLSEFRAKTASFIQLLHETKRPIVLTHRGRGAAVLLDINEYQDLMDTLELLKEVREAETQLKKGKGISHKDAKKFLTDLLNP